MFVYNQHLNVLSPQHPCCGKFRNPDNLEIAPGQFHDPEMAQKSGDGLTVSGCQPNSDNLETALGIFQNTQCNLKIAQSVFEMV